jgi:hypothetical protein
MDANKLKTHRIRDIHLRGCDRHADASRRDGVSGVLGFMRFLGRSSARGIATRSESDHELADLE